MHRIMDNKLPTENQIVNFRDKLLKWFVNNKRAYPWRETDDPFKVLIAEIMLRRTKADQVEDVYNKLFSEYPDIIDLVNADDEQLEQIIYPLGLKWRSPTFKMVAKEILARHDGKVPNTRELLLLLPGIGEYVAGAVLSIAYNHQEWLVDSNVVRLFKRYFGISTSKEGRRDKHVIELAKTYVSCDKPREANLAILDFSAVVCTPKNPDCSNCHLSPDCRYYHYNDVHL